MRFFLFLATCVCSVIVLSLDGCTDVQRKPAPTLAQKQPAGQSPSYIPPKQQPVAVPPPVYGQTAIPFTPMTLGEVKVAILLPLTGKNAALGQAMLNAAQQAVFDAGGSNFELQPHDTVAAGAGEAARAAIAEGAQLILGPLFAADVAAVKPIVQSSGLQMLPLTTDTTLADRGVYVMGLAPESQVDRIVAYAAAHGAQRFAALVQDTPYGALVGQEFRRAVIQQGALLVDIETYGGSPQDAAAKVQTLAVQRAGIDALFLPESGADLKGVADQLSAVGFDSLHTHILGTGLWDVSGVGAQSPLLNGGWYAAPDPAARRTFSASYKAAYGQEPPRLTTLAYDATALAAVLVKRGVRYSEAALTNPNGFAGLDGIFRLTPMGTVERGLAVNEVTPSEGRVIDSAPTSFVAVR